ncbi:MAG TPA: hypothetical protein DDX39_03665 [Bacteroidales bacterium]|nr:MAG: hypothetical protein A2W98_12655 [Bacteroidetes bacterium GWF2_33_38]HBF87718.1 hypothetical protein [Bacteroidales bacterium]
MKKILFIISFCLLGLLNLSATETPEFDGKITGKIVDKNSGQAVEYANIVLYRQSDSTMVTGTISDSNGFFEIQKIPSGNYYMVTNFIGYEKQSVRNIEINKNNKLVDLKNLAIQQAINTLADVEIVADRNYVDFKIDKKVVNVSQHINAEGGTAAEVLENVPSVTVDMEGNVALRGNTNYTVLVDGKPSPLKGSDALKQIPASIIENIEIITNPSAKYDPDGTTGIINVILKKDKRDGFNGMINLSGGTWKKYGGSANFNLRHKKTNYFITVDYNKNPSNMTAGEDRTNFLSDTVLNLEERSKRVETRRPWKINSGIDYYMNEKNTLSISGTYGGFGYFRDFNTKYYSYTEPVSEEGFILSDNYFSVDGIYYSGNLNFQHKFNENGHNLDASITLWQWNGNQFEDSHQQFADENWNPIDQSILIRTNTESIRNNFKITVDYVYPFKKSKFEVGANAHLNPGTTEYIFENYDETTETWINNEEFSNDMFFKQNIFAGYSTFSSEFKGFSYQLGLRLEYTDRLIHQKTTDEKFMVDLFNYYPTIHISKQLKENQQIQASYSRRINRPEPWELNPFPNYSDSYNSSKGNPYLRPEDTDAMELNYYKRIKKGFFSVGLYYRINHDTRVMNIQIDENNCLYLIAENIDRTSAYGSELMLNYDVKKWLNMNLSGNAYQYEMYGSLSERNVNQKSFNWDSRFVATVKLPKDIRFQINGFYSSPSVEAIGKMEASYSVGASFHKDFLEKKASIAVSINDIFGTQNYITHSKTEYYDSHIWFKGESQVVRLTLIYKINNYQRRQQQNGMEMNFGGGA